MSEKTKNVLSLLINVTVIVLTVISVAAFFIGYGKGNMQVTGFTCFRYFTTDSNILAAIASAVMLFCNIKALKNSEYVPPLNVIKLKFAGTAAVALTFLTVMCFLGSIYGYAAMFAGTNLFTHLITPLLSIISLSLLENRREIRIFHSFWGLVPSVIYALVYLVCVQITGIWPDFYSFTRGGLWYVSMAAMLGASLVICLGLHRIYMHFHRKIKNS